MGRSFEAVVEIATIMDRFGRPWSISSGWAILVGGVTHDHHDGEVGVFLPRSGAIPPLGLRRTWLLNALGTCHPSDPWLARLDPR
jgi:hypothetical protein